MQQIFSTSHSSLRRRRNEVDIAIAAKTVFEPRGTVRCIGEARFRSQAARDAACLLDVDPDVVDWSCSHPPLVSGASMFEVDFLVTRTSGCELVVVDEPDGVAVPGWVSEEAAGLGMELRIVAHADLLGHRLENARDLLRYTRWRVSLSQRITLLAALDAEGSLSLAECLSAVRGSSDPIGVIAALALRRFVELDLDSELLGPETRVIRLQR